MTVDARLNRETAGGATVPWLLVDDPDNPDSGLSDPVVDFQARALLTALLAELGQKYEGGPIAVDNFPAFPDDQKTHDDYQADEALEDQAGTGSVLDFTFSAAVQMAVVVSKGADLTSRASVSAVPSASKGWVCDDGVPTYIPASTSQVKVFAPPGTTVSVVGLRRS